MKYQALKAELEKLQKDIEVRARGGLIENDTDAHLLDLSIEMLLILDKEEFRFTEVEYCNDPPELA